jgi:hypothetical protein
MGRSSCSMLRVLSKNKKPPGKYSRGGLDHFTKNITRKRTYVNLILSARFRAVDDASSMR